MPEATRAADRFVLASRMLPAFGLGVMGTFLFFRWGWDVSTPLQRAVFALGALSVVAGLVLDWLAPAPDEATVAELRDAPGAPPSHTAPER